MAGQQQTQSTLAGIHEIYYFIFKVDEDGHDGHYVNIKKQGAGSNQAAILKKIRKCHEGTLPGDQHPSVGNPGRFKKLSIKRPSSRKKSLLVFGIAAGARFQKDESPVVVIDQKDQTAFPDTFILDRSGADSMKIARPGDSYSDDAWAAIIFDGDQDDETSDCRFAFMIDYMTDELNSSTGEPVTPNDPWPGPPHNTADP